MQRCDPRRRFKQLLDSNYFNGCRFHRVVPEFIIQWGIPGDPQAKRMNPVPGLVVPLQICCSLAGSYIKGLEKTRLWTTL